MPLQLNRSWLTVFRRLQNDNGRKDFLTNLVGKVKAEEVSQEEMSAHTSTLVWVSSILFLETELTA
jgi:hypothetical protein